MEMKPMAPSTSTAAADSLVVVHCPMKNADWLQVGSSIDNPYLGTSMPTCGSITSTIAPLMDGSSLNGTVKDYLAIARALDADKLDVQAVGDFKNAADKLPNEQYAALQIAIGKLQDANNLDGARLAFQSVSAELIHALLPAPGDELMHPVDPATK
jgi:hypothetical protein